MKHVSVKVKGKVQGVFFRAETKRKADELGLVGFVRNEEDGSVYLELEGEETLINELTEWLKRGGPELASLSDIEVQSLEEVVNFKDFTVRV